MLALQVGGNLKYMFYAGNFCNFSKFKVCLTQRSMLPIKYGNIDGVSYRLWQSQHEMLHTILLQKYQDVTHSPFAQA